MIKSKIFTIIYKAMQNEYNDQPTDTQQERECIESFDLS